MFSVARWLKKSVLPSLLLMMTLLSGCAYLFNPPLDTEEGYYEAAQKHLARENYRLAVSDLKTLQERFPFGRYTQAASLDLMFAQYQSDDFASAIIEADRFTRLHPDHLNVDYAWFVQAMSYYELYQNNAGVLGRADPATRSPKQGLRAFQTLTSYTRRFPESDYRQPALEAMVLLKDALARHELYVANFYMRKQTWLGAIERAKVIINDFPGVSAEQEAWVILVEAYDELNLTEERETALSELKRQFPNHSVFNNASNAYQSPRWRAERWWVKVLTLGLAS